MITETTSNFMQVLPPTPPDEFVEWLKGFSDAIGNNAPTDEQWKRIRDRLMVTKKQPSLTYPQPYIPIDPFPNQPWTPMPTWPNYPPITYTTTTSNIDLK